MTHDLDMNEDGTANMMYTGEVPWHGLGTKVEGLTTASEAIKAAGLDWDVVLKPVHFDSLNSDGDRELVNIPKSRAVVRSTDDRFLGLVSNQYKPIQNSESFDFFDSMMVRQSMRLPVLCLAVSESG